MPVEEWGFWFGMEEVKEGVVGAETEARTDMHWSMRPTISVTCLESSTFWSAVLPPPPPPVGSRRLPWMELLPILAILGATCKGNCCTGVDMLRLRLAIPTPLGVDMAAWAEAAPRAWMLLGVKGRLALPWSLPKLTLLMVRERLPLPGGVSPPPPAVPIPLLL